jgi:hypothetical protein
MSMLLLIELFPAKPHALMYAYGCWCLRSILLAAPVAPSVNGAEFCGLF